ncbi:MAG: hypothetical protein K2Y51_14205 [Gammaproteobacteria bacterium]|nr:hypothetical protein [Gammaproteobacteria bacterium]
MDEESRRKRRIVLRWAAIVPAALVLWYATIALALALNALLLRLCPQTSLLGGYCTAEWSRPAERAIAVGCAGLAALLVVLGSAYVAPAYRQRVALLLCVLGVGLSATMLGQLGTVPEFVAVILGGLLGVWVARTLPPDAVV